MGVAGPYILGLGKYLPSRVMTNVDWEKYVDTTDEWITTRTGIKTRRFAAENETTVDMCESAAKDALADAGISAQDIDEIIVATDTPEYRTPDTAAFLQHRLKTREVPTYDLGGSGCAGFVQAIDIARSRALSDKKTVLLVGAELASRLMDWTDRNTCVLFGDAAAAFVVSPEKGKAEIKSIVAGTDGSSTDILGIKVGGTKFPFTEERAKEKLHQKITMQGREVFRHAVARMTEATIQVTKKANVDLKDVKLVIPHQANLRILQAVGQKLNLPAEKLYINVQDYGNTGSASVPVALKEAIEKNLIHSGDYVALTSFGAGFHWAAALLRFS